MIDATGDTGSSDGTAGRVPASRIEHDGGLCEIGFDGNGFVFDNELPRHAVHLEPFALDARPVTCGEWIEFIEDGGYSRAELWLSDGWAACQTPRMGGASLLVTDDGSWRYYTLGGPREVDEAEPVCHVSYYEADAFARWAGARLPTEAEWEVVAADRSGDGQLPRPSGAPPEAGDRQLLAVRRRLAVDLLLVRRLPGLPSGERRRRRVQRQVHGQPVRASGRLLRDAGGPHAAHVPELLPSVRQMGLLGPATGPRRLIDVASGSSALDRRPPDGRRPPRGARARRAHRARRRSRSGSRRSGSTTTGAASCSTRSPGSPSTT